LSEPEERSGIRVRGEEALGDLAQALLDNPVFSQAMSTALGAGERAAQAQRSAMSAVGVPAVADLERLERRVRSLSGRLEAIEDRIDELADDLVALARREREAKAAGPDQRPSVPDAEA
jgi:chromosome segregation ATPase